MRTTPHAFRVLCAETGVTVGKLAGLLGCSERSVARWQSGTRRVPEEVALLLKTLRHVRAFSDYASTAEFLDDETRWFRSLAERDAVQAPEAALSSEP